MNEVRRSPSRQELLAAAHKTVADILQPGLKVVFCGINPGLYTAAIGHHFGRPGNRFWPALHLSGFTPRELSPYDERQLLELGCGITNIVSRASARADELNAAEYHQGRLELEEKMRLYKPGVLAVLGVGAYRTAFEKPKATLGLQEERIGETVVWVLPNPSGLNAHYDLGRLAGLFHELKQFVEGV